MKKYKHEYDSNLGPFGEERSMNHFINNNFSQVMEETAFFEEK